MLPLILAETEHEFALPAPIWVFPAIAAAVFLVLGLITYSYRDVAHRHSDKLNGSVDDQHGH